MGYWQISGESGASFGTGLVNIGEYRISGADLRLGSLQIGELTFQQNFRSTAEVATCPIDGQQAITLWRDGNRFFQGVVTKKRARNTTNGGWQIDYTVSDVWWWMQKTPLSGEVNDQTGDSKTRIMYELVEGNVKDHLTTILNRAIALGVPISIGAMDDCFVWPQITLKQMSCADAIAELLRIVPDSMTWIDYSGATPEFRMSRRGTAATATLEEGERPLVGVDVNPKYDLEVDQVTVTYVKRGVDGKTIYAEQISGHDGTAQSGTSTKIRLAADASDSDDAYNGLSVEILSGTGAGQTKTITDYDGSNHDATVDTSWSTNPDATSVYRVGNGSGAALKRQIFTVSGPELDSFLPNDYFDSYDAGAEAIDSDTNLELAIFGATNLFQDAIDAGLGTQLVFKSTGSQGFTLNVSTNPASGTYTHTVPAATYLDAEENTYNPSGAKILLGETPPEWMRQQYDLEEITIRGYWYYYFYYRRYLNGSLVEEFSLPAWFDDLPDNSIVLDGYVDFGSVDQRHQLYQGSYDVKVWATKSAVPAGIIYREADYVFVEPPEGLAAALRQTQAFVPYEGSLVVRDTLPGSVDYRGKVINVDNSLPEHATMGAMCQGVTINLASGIETLQLGTPARLSYLGLVDRFRRTASDNIIYL